MLEFFIINSPNLTELNLEFFFPPAAYNGHIITNSDLEKMRSALFAHGVIVMPGQNLTPKDHIRLAEFFGDIDVNRFFTPVSDYSVIAEVRTSACQSEVIGGTWHMDHSYDPAPAMCSILSARELPAYGGIHILLQWLPPIVRCLLDCKKCYAI